METLHTITSLLQPNDFLTSIDLKDAFHHISIHSSSRHFLRFSWIQQLYQYKVLPFGLSLSPWVFTKALNPLLRWARRQGIRTTGYLDDLLILASSKESAILYTRLVQEKLAQLGWLINTTKSQLVHSQVIAHLGMIIDSTNMTFTVPGKKVRSIQRIA